MSEFQNPTEFYPDIELEIELSGRIALEISRWESNIECKIELTRYQPVLLGVYIHQNLAQLQVNPNHIK